MLNSIKKKDSEKYVVFKPFRKRLDFLEKTILFAKKRLFHKRLGIVVTLGPQVRATVT
jgi:hypothetical protein